MPDAQPIPAESVTDAFPSCEQCGTPVEATQRYCVNCGAHRRHVPDPAAAFLAASRRPAPPARAAGPLRSRLVDPDGLGLLGALALALVPVAAAVGLAVGRASNNGDGRLIHALETQRAQVTTTALATSAPASGSAAASGSSRTSSTHSSTTHARRRASTHTTAPAAGASSTTPVAKVTGAKVTASAQQKGSAEAKQVQNSTGKNYVQADNNLPSSVVVGP